MEFTYYDEFGIFTEIEVKQPILTPAITLQAWVKAGQEECISGWRDLSVGGTWQIRSDCKQISFVYSDGSNVYQHGATIDEADSFYLVNIVGDDGTVKFYIDGEQRDEIQIPEGYSFLSFDGEEMKEKTAKQEGSTMKFVYYDEFGIFTEIEVEQPVLTPEIATETIINMGTEGTIAGWVELNREGAWQLRYSGGRMSFIYVKGVHFYRHDVPVEGIEGNFLVCLDRDGREIRLSVDGVTRVAINATGCLFLLETNAKPGTVSREEAIA